MGENAYVQQRIKQLHQLHKVQPADLEEVQSLMRQELDIFVDIIPGYKVKESHKQEHHAQVMRSRTVLEVEKLEHQTVELYEKYLNHLRKLTSQDKVVSVAAQASQCLAKLLPVASGFNFAGPLVEAVVRCANSPHRRIADPCVDSLGELFDTDGTGEGTLLAVGAIAKLIKLKGQSINPRIVSSLVHLRLSDVDVRHDAPRDLDDARRKDKKKKQSAEEKKIQNELKMADPTLSKDHVRHLQTALLRRVVAAYLRVLQQAQTAGTARQLRLLGPTLEGLAKFAKLIDIEMITLLIQAIRDIVEKPSTSPVIVAHGVLAVASLDSAAQEHHEQVSVEASRMAISTDLTVFYKHLYRVIPALLAAPTASELMDLHKAESMHNRDDGDGATGDALDTQSIVSGATGATTANKPHMYRNARAEHTKRSRVLLRALDLLLLRPKRLPLARAMAFAKRLSFVVPHQPPSVAMALVAFLRKLALKHPALSDVVCGVSDGSGQHGHFNSEAEEPDFACTGAVAPPMWELTALLRSYHPTTQVLAASVLRSLAFECNPHQEMKKHGRPNPSVIPFLQREPEDVLSHFDISYGDFVPEMALPPAKRRRTATDKKGDKQDEKQQKLQGDGEAEANDEEEGPWGQEVGGGASDADSDN